MREAGGNDDDADGGGFVRVSLCPLHRASLFLCLCHSMLCSPAQQQPGLVLYVH